MRSHSHMAEQACSLYYEYSFPLCSPSSAPLFLLNIVPAGGGAGGGAARSSSSVRSSQWAAAAWGEYRFSRG
eukprot:7246365-Pyramimonas_sp.AAC.1